MPQGKLSRSSRLQKGQSQMNEAQTPGESISLGHERNPSAGHTGKLAILFIAVTVAVTAITQYLTNDDHEVQEFLYLAYFVPIAIACRYFDRRRALIITGLIIMLYTVIFLPRILTQSEVHDELFIELFGRWGLFAAAGVALSTFRLGVAHEKEKVLDAEREKVERLELLMELSNTISASLKVEQVLQVLATRIVEAIDATYCSIFLLEDDGGHLRLVTSHSQHQTDWNSRLGMIIPLSELPHFEMAINSKESVIVGGRRDGDGNATRRIDEMLAAARSLLLYPLIVEGAAAGVVCIGEQRSWDRSPVSNEKTALCQTIVNQGAVAVGNALSHQALEEAFIGTIRSLAETIDAKDPSTRGHSDWASKYALMIGRQAGLDDGILENLRYAGYLHDIGKIGIPDEVLGKPGRLTQEEWKLMKKHPIISAKILEPVRISDEVKAAIRHHHERFDGKGYPYGLAGETIPLEARILAVADSFEAMTSTRPYREALTDEQAVAELVKCSGTQFDPEIVRHFLAALGRPAFGHMMEFEEERPAAG